MEDNLICPECDSKQIYTTSKERVCRRCGCRWKSQSPLPKRKGLEP